MLIISIMYLGLNMISTIHIHSYSPVTPGQVSTSSLLHSPKSNEHVQNLTTALPFLQTSLRSYHASTTLIPFLPRSSGSHYALVLFRERSKDLVETWPGVTGVLHEPKAHSGSVVSA